jgi:hypothetical protein
MPLQISNLLLLQVVEVELPGLVLVVVPEV